MTADGRRARLAAALWLVFAFIVWHVRFDDGIDTAARTYLFTQHQYVLGRAPLDRDQRGDAAGGGRRRARRDEVERCHRGVRRRCRRVGCPAIALTSGRSPARITAT